MTDKKEKSCKNQLRLDEEKCVIQYVYIKHIGDNVIHKVAYASAKHSKFIREFVINNQKDPYGKSENNPLIIPYTLKLHTLQFIIDYMDYMDCKNETSAPEAPLQDIHLSVIFKAEYELFKDLHQNDKDPLEKILEINDYIISAMYFSFDQLHKKLAAVMASIFNNLSYDELKLLK
jgi:hypothetical protein